ncbi:MAG: leucyl/phenylalanyl-tRNA--protein transferase [Deltaproteobacteria bacterium]|nr:MAG: leucyl/phenylalanyl-tRNA--protein transferase [Deltaproteobacteria bacterium]
MVWLHDGDPFPEPDPEETGPGGLVAIGGSLSAERLLDAYRKGAFPWYNEGEPVLWYSLAERMVLEPHQLRLDRSVRRNLRRASGLLIRTDTAFERVIRACASIPRPGQRGTWITREMIEAYSELHRLGYAHSVEAWDGAELAGGLYGVCLGKAFFGESMFRKRTGASLAALVTLVRWLAAREFLLFDCQTYADHTARLGARLWPRRRFLALLARALEYETKPGPWRLQSVVDQNWTLGTSLDSSGTSK